MHTYLNLPTPKRLNPAAWTAQYELLSVHGAGRALRIWRYDWSGSKRAGACTVS